MNSWINNVSEGDGIVVFIAHNGIRFDHKILRHHYTESTGLELPPNWFFADSLPLSKEKLGLKSYSVANLARSYLKKEVVGLLTLMLILCGRYYLNEAKNIFWKYN